MQIPLKLKWLGKETAEICRSITPFHPLILISPAPQLSDRDVPENFVRLPHSICRLFDLNAQRSVREEHDVYRSASQTDLRSSGAPCAFDVIEFKDDAQNFAALYEFYFEVFLKNSAVKGAHDAPDYQYIEQFHSALLEHNFIALVRAFRDSQIVAGLLLRRPTAPERFLNSIGVGKVAIVDVLSINSTRSTLANELVSRGAQWAREADYSFLSATPCSALVTTEHDWTIETASMLSWPEQPAALLYCDLHRCSYLSNDIYFYSISDNEVALHYVANRGSGSETIRLLSSTPHIKKTIYTRHPEVSAALFAAGFHCEEVSDRCNG
jgi:hypothetical protein